MTEQKQLAEMFGLDEKTAAKAKDYKPIFELGKMGEKDTFKGQITSEKPRMVECKDINSKDPNAKIKVPVIEVIDELTGMEMSIFLSSTSLRMAILNLYKKAETLKDLNIVIGVRTYDHKQYGETRGYTVQLDHRKNGFNFDKNPVDAPLD